MIEIFSSSKYPLFEIYVILATMAILNIQSKDTGQKMIEMSTSKPSKTMEITMMMIFCRRKTSRAKIFLTTWSKIISIDLSSTTTRK